MRQNDSSVFVVAIVPLNYQRSSRQLHHLHEIYMEGRSCVRPVRGGCNCSRVLALWGCCISTCALFCYYVGQVRLGRRVWEWLVWFDTPAWCWRAFLILSMVCSTMVRSETVLWTTSVCYNILIFVNCKELHAKVLQLGGSAELGVTHLLSKSNIWLPDAQAFLCQLVLCPWIFWSYVV